MRGQRQNESLAHRIRRAGQRGVGGQAQLGLACSNVVCRRDAVVQLKGYGESSRLRVIVRARINLVLPWASEDNRPVGGGVWRAIAPVDGRGKVVRLRVGVADFECCNRGDRARSRIARRTDAGERNRPHGGDAPAVEIRGPQVSVRTIGNAHHSAERIGRAGETGDRAGRRIDARQVLPLGITQADVHPQISIAA